MELMFQNEKLFLRHKIHLNLLMKQYFLQYFDLQLLFAIKILPKSFHYLFQECKTMRPFHNQFLMVDLLDLYFEYQFLIFLNIIVDHFLETLLKY